jgi:hypothetical protein
MARKLKAKPQKNLGPFYLMAAGLLVLVGGLIWLAIAQSSPSSSTSSTFNDLPFPTIDRITVTDARTAFDENTAVFVDVRDSASFNSSHIPGARNIYLTEFETRYSELSKDDWIILYCT